MRLLVAVVLGVMTGTCSSVNAFKQTLTAKVRESRWGNGIFELAFVGVGCRVAVVNMNDTPVTKRVSAPSPANLFDGVIATSEVLCQADMATNSSAVSTLGVSLSGNSLLVASASSEYLIALELVYEGEKRGRLVVTNVMRLNGDITRISDSIYSDSLGSEVYYVTTYNQESKSGSVLCVRNSRNSLQILSTGLMGTSELRDIIPTTHDDGSLFVSLASGMMKLQQQGQNMTIITRMKSPGTGNDGFALFLDKYAFVAARDQGFRVFDLSNGSLSVSRTLPEGSGWAGGVAVKDITDANSEDFKILAVVAADAGIFGYHVVIGPSNSTHVELAWTVKLGDSCGSEQGCGWNIVMGSNKCKVYVSDKGMGLYVVNICLNVPTVVGTLQV